MDGHIKNVIAFIHNNLKRHLKPNDYYRFLDKLILVLSVELDERLKEIEYKGE